MRDKLTGHIFINSKIYTQTLQDNSHSLTRTPHTLQLRSHTTYTSYSPSRGGGDRSPVAGGAVGQPSVVTQSPTTSLHSTAHFWTTKGPAVHPLVILSVTGWVLKQLAGSESEWLGLEASDWVRKQVAGSESKWLCLKASGWIWKQVAKSGSKWPSLESSGWV